jgi:hypothetical protein
VRRLIWVAACTAFLCAQWSASAAAATLEPIGDFTQPISITSDPSNPERLLVAEREGIVNEVTGGGVKQLVDLSSLVACCESERGLLSIAPAPGFDSSGRVYIAYTGTPAAGGAEGDVYVDSFRPDPQDAEGFIREQILSIAHSLNPNHNGGQLQFGPDGHLYISFGDGGGGGDPLHSGQDTEVLLGKVLRIDPHPGEQPAYTIPAENPFVGSTGRDEVWAYGLRNPWRFSFDRMTGDMVIGDVGQNDREEVDFATSTAPGTVGGAGANYGWNCREGFISYPGAPGGCGPASSFSEPVFDYPHSNPEDGSTFGCSIIGGYVVRDPSLGDLYGRYIYTDFCTAGIRSLALPAEAGGVASGDRSEGLTVAKPTTFGQDSCGRLYVASDEGEVFRLAGAAPAECAVAPPGEEGPPADGTGTPPSGTGQSGNGTRPLPLPIRDGRIHLGLRAQDAGLRTMIIASVSPCAVNAGEGVQLNRGGERFAAARLNSRCVAHFFARVAKRATFRALLPATPQVRSRRLVVAPAQAQGSR